MLLHSSFQDLHKDSNPDTKMGETDEGMKRSKIKLDHNCKDTVMGKQSTATEGEDKKDPSDRAKEPTVPEVRN